VLFSTFYFRGMVALEVGGIAIKALYDVRDMSIIYYFQYYYLT
jgi:hypothetical protein